MVIDDRGTGASGGKWDSWGQRTQDDYKEVLDWIQAQPWSIGGVATTGESYMGITSLLIAEADAARVAEGKPRAVKAVWADIPMADAYRDVTFQGGALDSGFMPLWLGLVTGLSDLPPSSLSADPQDAAAIYLEHLIGNGEFSVEQAGRRDARRRSVPMTGRSTVCARRSSGRRQITVPGRDPGRLVRPLPARRAAAVGIAAQLARPRADHVAALPHHRRAARWKTRTSRRSGSATGC